MNPNTDLITVLESTTARLCRETVDRLGAREMLINELAPFIYPQMHRYDGKLAEAASRDRQLLIKSQAIADLASSLYATIEAAPAVIPEGFEEITERAWHAEIDRHNKAVQERRA